MKHLLVSSTTPLNCPSLVAYNLHKGPGLAVLIQNSPSGVRLQIKNRKQFNLRRNDIFAAGQSLGSDEQIWSKQIEEVEDLCKQEADQFDLELLHQMLLESHSENGLDFGGLAQLYFGTIDLPKVLALARVLAEDHCYFRRRKDEYIPNSPDHVARYFEQVRRLEEKKKYQEEAVRWLNGGETNLHSETLLQDLILLAARWPREMVQQYDTIFDQAGLTSKEALRQQLVQAGLVDRDFFFELLEVDYPTTHNPLPEDFKVILEHSALQDLTHLPAFTVDDESTNDRDDALSFDRFQNRFYVHISNVACMLNGHELLEKEMQKRMTSLYLPETTYSMLPESLINDLSLNQNKILPSMSVCMWFEEDALKFEILPSKIEIEQNLSYPFVEEHKQDFEPFYAFARQLLQLRVKNGALSFNGPEIEFSFTDQISLQRKDLIESQSMIAEFSIAANYCFARFCEENKIPILYRIQTGRIDEVLNHPLYTPQITEFYPYYCVKKAFGKTSFETTNKGHFSLGLTHYTQMSSPIRRYVDYWNQKQLFAFFSQTPVQAQQEIEQAWPFLSGSLQDFNALQTKREKHFILRYVEQELNAQRNPSWIAVLLEVFAEDVLFRVHDLGQIFKLSCAESWMKPGMSVRFKPTGVDVRLKELRGELLPV